MHKAGAGYNTKTVNEFIDRMAADLQQSIGENSKVRMRRSKVETSIQIVLRGNPEETESQIQKIFTALVPASSATSESHASAPDLLTETTPEPAAPESSPNYSNPFEPIFDPSLAQNRPGASSDIHDDFSNY